MEDTDLTLEIIKIARELAVNEHTDRVAQIHNRWLAENDVVWRTQRLRLQYPQMPKAPTDNEIKSRAKVLLDWISEATEDPPTKASVEVSKGILPSVLEKIDQVHKNRQL